MLEPLAEERVTPNALAVLLSSCPLVWIFCARWKDLNACWVRAPHHPIDRSGIMSFIL